MAKNDRHNLPPRVTSLMWLSLIRAPWLMSSLLPPSDGQYSDGQYPNGPRVGTRNGRFRDY